MCICLCIHMCGREVDHTPGLHVGDYVWVDHLVDQNSALTSTVTCEPLEIVSIT